MTNDGHNAVVMIPGSLLFRVISLFSKHTSPTDDEFGSQELSVPGCCKRYMTASVLCGDTVLYLVYNYIIRCQRCDIGLYGVICPVRSRDEEYMSWG